MSDGLVLIHAFPLDSRMWEGQRLGSHTVTPDLPGFGMAPWIGIIVPIKTPKEVVARLSQETLAVMRDPEVVKLLTEQQVTPMATGPQAFEELIKKDLERWEKVVKSAGIKAE